MNEKKPVLIIVAGPNGSGKTSVTGRILQHQWMEDSVYINPDIVATDVTVTTVAVCRHLIFVQETLAIQKKQQPTS